MAVVVAGTSIGTLGWPRGPRASQGSQRALGPAARTDGRSAMPAARVASTRRPRRSVNSADNSGIWARAEANPMDGRDQSGACAGLRTIERAVSRSRHRGAYWRCGHYALGRCQFDAPFPASRIPIQRQHCEAEYRFSASIAKPNTNSAPALRGIDKVWDGSHDEDRLCSPGAPRARRRGTIGAGDIGRDRHTGQL